MHSRSRARTQKRAGPIRTTVGTYLAVGVVLQLIGFFATGPCPYKNVDIVSDVVFVLIWPVGLYRYVIAGSMSPQAWLHQQACEGGMGSYRAALRR
jgi:hypothetical protein